MSPIDASSPRPRDTLHEYRPVRLATGEVRYLEIPQSLQRCNLWDVIDRRRSRRTFLQVSDHEISGLLWYTAKVVATNSVSEAMPWEHRPTPSAGGIHPIDLILQPYCSDEHQLLHYDALAHALRVVENGPDAYSSLRNYANEVLDTQHGTVLWLVADFNKTAAKYTNAESLVWRDAGALIGMLCLVAEALQLSCCALGISGDEVLHKVFSLQAGVHGVGAVVVGGRTDRGTRQWRGQR